MSIKLINWPTSTGNVWIVNETGSGYSPIKQLDTKDINSPLAQSELELAIAFSNAVDEAVKP